MAALRKIVKMSDLVAGTSVGADAGLPRLTAPIRRRLESHTASLLTLEEDVRLDIVVDRLMKAMDID